ncbi:MAG TPA: hypothetical protein VLV25_04715 [Steroidobacteraceae bacterium]|nr:hypothetical protein [Steroidobacteraceae bacterium]HUL46379.1 hypothetical protein [Steroidobacteraceae bacterium]
MGRLLTRTPLEEELPPPAAGGGGAPPLEPRRLLTAFCLTPLLAGFYPAIFLAEPTLMPLGLIVAYISTVAFGVPLVLLFGRRLWRSWWQYCIGGAVCAVPALLVYAFARTPDHVQAFGLMPALAVLAWGASSGFVFWMLGVAGDSPVSIATLLDPNRPRK